MAVSANRLELLQIVDAVAREKSIDRANRARVDGRRDAEGRALALRPGNRGPRRDQSENRRNPVLAAASRRRRGRERSDADDARGGAEEEPFGPDRRLDRRIPAPVRLRAHPRPGVEAGAGAEDPRGRARQAIRCLQGPHRRHHQRRGQAGRVRQRRGRSRRLGGGRGGRAARRIDPARDVPARRPDPRLCLRRPARGPRAADLPVPHPPPVHLQAVRPGSAGNLRRHRRGEVGGARSGLARQDRGHVERFFDRPGRRLRRHARLAGAGGRQRIAGREDRHHSLVSGRRDLHRQRASAGRGDEGRARRGFRPASRSSFPTTSCRWRSAGAGRMSASPRSSPAGTSIS